MPLAVAHVLFPLVVVDLFRHLTKSGKKFISRPMVLFDGISGFLPNNNNPIFLLIYYFFPGTPNFHRTITHTIWLPVVGILLFFALKP